MRTSIPTIVILLFIGSAVASAGELGSVGRMLGTVGGNSYPAMNYATPLPPGPGSVPLSIPGQPFAAPVLMPIGAPTAAPVGIYQYPTPTAISTGSVEVTEPTAECGQHGLYASAEFLYAGAQGSYLPPLVTFSPAGTPGLTAGALYRPTTFTLLGGQRAVNNFRPGFRLNAGYWFDPERTQAVDANFFFLGDVTEQYQGVTAPGGIILARPAVNGLTNTQVGFSLGTAGPAGIAASLGSSFIGGDVNYRRALGCDSHCDLLLGYRYLNQGDVLTVYASQGAMTPVPMTLSQTFDQFRTRNNFHGPQIGFRSRRDLGGRFSFEVLAKVALGVTIADLDAVGVTSMPNGSLATGLLVAPSNAGSRTTTYFGVVPEAGLKLAYGLTDNVRFSTGYTFLYWSQVRRAADQVDLTVLAPGRPGFPNRTTDYWVQGWSMGLEWRY